MKTLLLDTVTWDLVVDANGDIAMASEPYAIAQDAASQCRLFQGELWYDTSQGVPYWQAILGQMPPIAYLRAQYERAAELVPDVADARVFIASITRDRVVTGQVQVTQPGSTAFAAANFGGFGIPSAEATEVTPVTAVENPHVLAGPVFSDPDFLNLYYSFSVPPDTARQAAMMMLIFQLKQAGVWPLLDVLYVFAARDFGSALVNWKNPGTFNATTLNSPGFIQDRGFVTDGVTQHINTNFNPSALTGVNYGLNSASIGIRQLDNVQKNTSSAGNFDGTNGTTILPCATDGNLQARVNVPSAGNHEYGPSSPLAFSCVSRVSSVETDAYVNGRQCGQVDSDASSSVASGMFVIGGSGAGGFTPGRFASFFVGAGLTAAQVQAFFLAENAYMTTVGAVLAVPLFSDPDFVTLFYTFANPPDATRQTAIMNFMGALKTAGVWQLLDALYVFAAADSQAALINWKAPAVVPITTVGGPTFTRNRGFSVVADSKYVSTGINPTVLSGGYVGNDNSTVVLLHLDGTNGSTTITDVNAGGSAKTWTAFGNAQISTATFEFGGASLLCDGSGDFVSTPSLSELSPGLRNFTIDLWFNVQGAGGTILGMVGKGTSFAAGSFEYGLCVNTSNFVEMSWSDGTTRHVVQGNVQYTGALNPGWHHVAFVRSGDTAFLFVDGLQQATASVAGQTIPSTSSALAVGSLISTGANFWNGNLDEVRVSLGVARWTSTFIPPKTAYVPPGLPRTNFDLSAAHLTVRSLTPNLGVNSRLFSCLDNSAKISVNQSGTGVLVRLNDADLTPMGSDSSAARSAGWFAGARSGSLKTAYIDGVKIGTETLATAELSDDVFYFGHDTGGAASYTVASGSIGGALTDAQVAAFFAAEHAYMLTVGAVSS